METQTKATIEDLYKVKKKAELVNGVIVRMSPTGWKPAHASFQITMSLQEYVRRTGIGFAVPDNAAFVVDLPNRRSFSPDASYFIGADPGMKFFDGAPVFAAEVRSESDYGPAAERAMAAKRADYFAAGTQVVWDVDLQSEEVVRVYRTDAPESLAIYRRGEQADAEPAVPGWAMPVDQLFS